MIADIPCRASRHITRKVKGFLQDYGGGIVLLRLPVGTPELGVVGKPWLQMRWILARTHLPDLSSEPAGTWREP